MAIVLNSLSSNSIQVGQTLTLYGTGMSAQYYVNFEPAHGAIISVQASSGTATQMAVAVPTTLGTESYQVFASTTGMGGGDTSNKKPLSVQNPGKP